MIPDPQRALTPEEQAEAGLPRVWPFAIADRVRFGEVDRLGHVNNAAYLTWYETVRTAWIGTMGFSGFGAGEPVMVIRRAEIDWLAEMKADEAYVVTLAVESYRRTSFTLACEVWAGGTCRSTFRCVLVHLGVGGTAKTPLPETLTALFRDIHGATPEG